MKNKRAVRSRNRQTGSLLLQFFDPKRMILLFLSGFAMGVFLISLGWASPPKKAHKASAAFAHRPQIHKQAVAAVHRIKVPPVPGNLYQHPEGLYKFRYPSTWQVNATESAMVIKSPDDVGVMGIVQRPDDQPNDEAVSKELQVSDRPTELKQASARVAGLAATKLIGSKKDDPYTKTVEYYLQHPNGHQYYILLMAPQRDWNRYNVAFGSMLRTLSFH